MSEGSAPEIVVQPTTSHQSPTEEALQDHSITSKEPGRLSNRTKLQNIGVLLMTTVGLAASNRDIKPVHHVIPPQPSGITAPSPDYMGEAPQLVMPQLEGILNRLDSLAATPTSNIDSLGKNQGESIIEAGAHFSHESLLSEREGFGAATTGGHGGELIIVTSLNDNPENPAPGTLRWALQRDEPAIIRFGVNGTIPLLENILVGSNKTIDGRGSEIVLTQNGLNIKDKENIIIANIALTDGFNDDDHKFADEEGAGDAINISNSQNIWIHHVSASKYYDGLIDIINGSSGITVSWSELSEHNKAVLIGNDQTKEGDKITTVTLHHNVFRHLEQRMPRVRFGKVDLYNNYYTDWDDYVIGVTMDGQAIVEGNIFEPGAETGEDRKRIVIEDIGDDTREGMARVTDNLALNGSIVESTASFDQVFTRPYLAQIDSADTLLKDRLLRTTGVQPSSFYEHKNRFKAKLPSGLTSLGTHGFD